MPKEVSRAKCHYNLSLHSADDSINVNATHIDVEMSLGQGTSGVNPGADAPPRLCIPDVPR